MAALSVDALFVAIADADIVLSMDGELRNSKPTRR
jgi:hypothetical protein